MNDPNVLSAALAFITGGGLVSAIVALKKDRRDARQNDLDYTKQFRDIAKQEVQDTRDELAKTDEKVRELELRIADLEMSVKLKDKIIGLLVEYIGGLRDVLDLVKPTHPLPKVPDEIKDYLK